jgi:hypothetical protein
MRVMEGARVLDVCTVRAPVLSSSISEVCHPLWLSVQGTCSVERTVVPQALLMPAALSCAANGIQPSQSEACQQTTARPPDPPHFSASSSTLSSGVITAVERGHDLPGARAIRQYRPSGTLAC